MDGADEDGAAGDLFAVDAIMFGEDDESGDTVAADTAVSFLPASTTTSSSNATAPCNSILAITKLKLLHPLPLPQQPCPAHGNRGEYKLSKILSPR